jgi:hypothetical protein
MALKGRSGQSVYLGTQAANSVVRFSVNPPFILGKCGRCGAQKECTNLAFGAGMSTLDGGFDCKCGARVRLSVPLGFRNAGGF